MNGCCGVVNGDAAGFVNGSGEDGVDLKRMKEKEQ